MYAVPGPNGTETATPIESGSLECAHQRTASYPDSTTVTNQRNNNSLLLDQRFVDVDAISETVVGWTVDLTQLERGPFRGRVRQWQDGDILLMHASFRRRLSQRGFSPGGRLTLAIPATTDFDVRYRGQQAGSDHIMIFPTDGELDSVSSANFDVFTLSLPATEGALAELYSDVHGQACRCSTETMNVLRRALRRSEARASGAADDEPTAIPALLLEALRSGLTPLDAAPCEADRRRALRSALAHIDARLRRTIRAADLCRATGVSERTLQYAFQAEFGLSPMSYVAARRLRAVRRELLRANAHRGAVAAIARAYGMRHGGRFATDYHAMFGEYPSDTLGRGVGDSPDS